MKNNATNDSATTSADATIAALVKDREEAYGRLANVHHLLTLVASGAEDPAIEMALEGVRDLVDIVRCQYCDTSPKAERAEAHAEH